MVASDSIAHDSRPLRWSERPWPADASGTSPTLFESAQWAGLIASLGGRCWYGIEQQEDRKVSLFVWRRGPLKIGYLGFPVTPAWIAAAYPDPFGTPNLLPERIDLLRSNFSLLDGGGYTRSATTALPESAIPDLGTWPLRNKRKILKDVVFAKRHGVALRAALPSDAMVIHRIYSDTVNRHQGRLRYKLAYFIELLALSTKNEDVRISLASHDEAIAGFCVSVRQGDRGYYLHAGVAADCRRFGASDLLADDAIAWAIARGCRDFSLMASPPDQPGLPKFKQKWSEVDGQWSTEDHTRGVAGALLAAMLKLKR